MAISYVPGRLMCPLQQKSRVPALFSVPSDLNHAPPRWTMWGRFDSVSTLLTTVGLPYRPLSAGNGGFSRGSPCVPPVTR